MQIVKQNIEYIPIHKTVKVCVDKYIYSCICMCMSNMKLHRHRKKCRKTMHSRDHDNVPLRSTTAGNTTHLGTL